MLRLGRFFDRRKRSAERRRRRGENVAPAESAAGGAPGGAAPLRHWGARAGSQRRAADPRKVRQGCLASTPAPPGAPFPSSAREKENGKGRARRPKIQVPGRRSVVYL